MIRNPEIMESLKQFQQYIVFLKNYNENNFTETEINKIIVTEEQKIDNLCLKINDPNVLLSLPIDEMTTEEVYDRVMSKDY